MTNNKFNFFVGVDIDDDIYKSASKSEGEDRYANMQLWGLASDNSEDGEGQTLEPSGYDITDFLKSGLVNLEHLPSRKGDPQFWVGEPVDAKIEKNKFFVKAKLWKDRELARNFWDTILIMKSSGSTRKAGFSIEGKALSKDPMNKNRITKAKINHIALTFSPVNKNSWLDIVKGEQKEDFIEPEIDSSEDPKYIYEFEKAGKCYGVKKNFEIEEKEEDEEDEEEKAVTTTNSAPLRSESVDGATKKIIKKGLRLGKISPKKAYKFIKSFYNS